jgi:hypothetical protein
VVCCCALFVLHAAGQRCSVAKPGSCDDCGTAGPPTGVRAGTLSCSDASGGQQGGSSSAARTSLHLASCSNSQYNNNPKRCQIFQAVAEAGVSGIMIITAGKAASDLNLFVPARRAMKRTGRLPKISREIVDEAAAVFLAEISQRHLGKMTILSTPMQCSRRCPRTTIQATSSPIHLQLSQVNGPTLAARHGVARSAI